MNDVLIIFATVLAAALAAGFAAPAIGIIDAALEKTKALPGGASSATTDGIDLGHGAQATHPAGLAELELEAPALATGELGDTETMTYIIEHDDNADFSAAATLNVGTLVQTGAGGAGAAAASERFRLPTDVKRYVRAKATNSAAGDASGKSMTLRLRT